MCRRHKRHFPARCGRGSGHRAAGVTSQRSRRRRGAAQLRHLSPSSQRRALTSVAPPKIAQNTCQQLVLRNFLEGSRLPGAAVRPSADGIACLRRDLARAGAPTPGAEQIKLRDTIHVSEIPSTLRPAPHWHSVAISAVAALVAAASASAQVCLLT